MKRVLLAGAGLMALVAAQPAAAADLPARMPVKAPVAVIQGYDWSGFYIGINGGGAWGRSDFTSVTGPGVAFDVNGGLVGGQIGVNWQWTNWVFGIEADADWARIRGSAPCPNPAFACRTELDAIGTVRGRLGLAWDRALLYGTGGFAWGRTRAEVASPAGLVTGSTETQVGWTAGLGVEYALAPNWSVKLEWLHYDLGTDRFTGFAPNGPDADIRSRGEIVRAGLNYRFNWGPVVAKY